MDFINSEIIYSLLAIVLIDLVLAGDNAIVIGMAASSLPVQQQKKAILWGILGAIAVRIAATIAVVWVLQIPALMIGGGVILIWIAFSLIVNKKKHSPVNTSTNLGQAIQTIIIADGVMSIDNVMGIAGIAHDDMLLVFAGLLISIPIIIWGSSLFMNLIHRYPGILYLGGAVLAWTAGGLITDDPLLDTLILSPQTEWMINLMVVFGVLTAAWARNHRKTSLVK